MYCALYLSDGQCLSTSMLRESINKTVSLITAAVQPNEDSDLMQLNPELPPRK
jgi:hypothetical protein